MSNIALGEGLPRTITIPGEGLQVLGGPLPQLGRFVVESVVASIDTSGSGPVTPELTVADPSGVVIATKAQTSPIPGASSGLATWALRLSDDGAGFTLPTASITIYKGNAVAINAAAGAFLPWNTLFFGPAELDLTTPTQPVFLTDGLYWVSAIVQSIAPLAAGKFAAGQLAGHVGPIDTTAETLYNGPTMAGAVNQSMSILLSAKAGAYVNVNVTNQDTVARSFKLFQASIEKVL